MDDKFSGGIPQRREALLITSSSWVHGITGGGQLVSWLK
jgi:hypothetical protein